MKKLLAFGALIAAICIIRADAQVVPAPPGTVAMVCANNTSVPSPTSGKFFYVQCDANGKLITSGTGGGGGGSSGIVAGTTTTTGITSGHFVGSNGTTVQDQTAVTSLTAGCGLTASPSTIVGTGSFNANVTARNNTATTDTITSTDCGTVVTENNASAVAAAITTAGFSTGNYFTAKNLGAGVATYTPSSGTINGAATLVCLTGQSADVYFDGTNYQTLGNTCSAASTIAGGNTALGTGSISSATCATAVTATALGVASTDALIASFNGDPSASTGYIPSTAGMLTILGYPSSGQANFKVCNNTAGTITPSPITLNWRVVR